MGMKRDPMELKKELLKLLLNETFLYGSFPQGKMKTRGRECAYFQEIYGFLGII